MQSRNPSLDEAGNQRSDTPCYTCRRRRVICDRALPTCRKCHLAGRQCLGYKKPLTWVRGLASRGKMMGLTFDDVAGNQHQHQQKPHSENIWVERKCNLETCNPCPHTKLRTVQKRGSNQLSPESEGVAPVTPLSMVSDDFSGFSSTSPNSPYKGHEVYFESENQRRIRPALVDPLFHGISHIERHYLSYCKHLKLNQIRRSFANRLYHVDDKRVCKLMVLFEVPDRNPYRQLIPLGGTSPTLRSTIAAVAACHYMHTCNRNSLYSISSQDRPFGPPRSSLPFDEEFANSPDPTVRSVYRHVLAFKHLALSRLKNSLSSPQRRDSDTTIASVLLLIALDMIQSGHGDWKIHMDGAKGLVKARLGDLAGKMEIGGEHALLPTLYSNLDTFLTSTCMT